MTALFSWTNHVDRSGAVLGASQTAGDLSADNMAKPQMALVWRTTSPVGYGEVDFGANVDVGCLALRFKRVGTSIPPTSGTIRHLLDVEGGTPGAGGAYDSTAVTLNVDAAYGYHLHVPLSGVTARYWRFTFDTPGAPFLDVGRAWAGNAFRPRIDVSFPYEDAWGDRSIVSAAARSGVEWIDSQPLQRSLGISLRTIHEDDRLPVRQMMRSAGTSGQILFCLDPSTADGRKLDTIIGRRSQNRPLSHSVASDPRLYSTSLTIRESL